MDNSMSLDISKEVYSERKIVKNNVENVDDQIDYQAQTQTTTNDNDYNQQKMGKMIMLSRKFNIFIGPNYGFFIIGFLMTLTMSSILLFCVLTKIKIQDQNPFKNQLIRYIAVILTVWVNIMYLMTALSDPGLYRPGMILIKQTDNLRNCSACKIKVPQNVRHCFTCDICIIDLDHHCPWMSKCVAKGNMKTFQGYLGGGALMMALFWYTMFMMITQ